MTSWGWQYDLLARGSAVDTLQGTPSTAASSPTLHDPDHDSSDHSLSHEAASERNNWQHRSPPHSLAPIFFEDKPRRLRLLRYRIDRADGRIQLDENFRLSRGFDTRGKNLLRSADFVFPEEADDGFDAPLTEAWRQSAREGAGHGLFADVDDCPGHKVRWVSRQKPFFFVKSAEALGAMQSQSPRMAPKKVVGVWSEPGTIEFFCYETNRSLSYYTLAHLFQAFDCRLNTGRDGQDPFAPSVLTQVVTARCAPPGHTPRRAPRRHKWVNVDPGRSPAKQVELREDNVGVRCFRREDNEGIVLGVSPCGRFVLLRLRLEHAWLQNMNPRQHFSRQCNPIATMFGRVASAASRNPDHATAYPTVYLMWDLCDGGQGWSHHKGGRVILLPNLEYPDVFDRDEGFHLNIPTSGRESTATSEISTAPSTSGVQEGGRDEEDPEAPSYVEVVDFRTWLKKTKRSEHRRSTSSGSRCWLYVLANLLLPTRLLGRRLGAQEKEAHMRALFHQGKEEAEMVDRTRFQHGDVHKKHKSLFDSTISNWDRLLGGTGGANLLGDEETSEDEGGRSCFGRGTTRRAEVNQLKGRGNAISMAFLQRTDVGRDWSPLVHGWARGGGNELWYN
eukprot:g10826.t1